MMRKYLLLCLVLIASICAFSQNTSTVTITSEQLKTTNLIFAEHQKLSERVQLLYYGNIIEDKNRSIEGLNKSLKKKQNVIKYGAAGSCVLILLCLLLK